MTGLVAELRALTAAVSDRGAGGDERSIARHRERGKLPVRERVERDGSRVELERRVIARDWDPELMGRWDYLPPSALGVRRALYQRLGGFDESFRYSEDWDFLMRAAAANGVPRRVAGVTVEVRMRDHGLASGERGPERRACLDRLAARHGLAPIPIATFWEVAEAVRA